MGPRTQQQKQRLRRAAAREAKARNTELRKRNASTPHSNGLSRFRRVPPSNSSAQSHHRNAGRSVRNTHVLYQPI
jgi:hypothetical protein